MRCLNLIFFTFQLIFHFFIFIFILFFHFVSSPLHLCAWSSTCFISSPIGKTKGRNKDVLTKSNFSTWDPRKLGKGGPADPLGPQYDEIPYGDVAPPHISGRGMLPEVPAEYAQVPMIPARMGKNWDEVNWNISTRFSLQLSRL
jgi:hypothetical protein